MPAGECFTEGSTEKSAIVKTLNVMTIELIKSLHYYTELHRENTELHREKLNQKLWK